MHKYSLTNPLVRHTRDASYFYPVYSRRNRALLFSAFIESSQGENMHLPKFEYLCPPSLNEAARLLQEYGYRARLVAGGTDLYPRMKYGLENPEIVVSLKGLSVKAPTLMQDGNLRLDPLMTLTDLACFPTVRKNTPLLSEAALCVGSNELRNMGTLGGNLCQETRCLYYNQSHRYQFVEPCFKRGGDGCYFIPKGKKCWAVFQGDLAPALFCLGAEVKIMGPENSRRIPVADLYSGDARRPVTISSDEILAEVLIPGPPHHRGEAYGKFCPRKGFEFGALCVAAVLDTEDDRKTCSEALIAVGAVSASPLRARKAETILAGKRLSSELFSEAAQVVAEELSLVPHHGYSQTYLTECLRVQTRRVLAAAAGRIGKRERSAEDAS